MRELTLEYLRGVVATLFYTHDELIGGKIEDEKQFDINARLDCNDFKIVLSYTSALKDVPGENDFIPVTCTQTIYVKRDTKISKVIKDVIAEMEVIYNAPTPETVAA